MPPQQPRRVSESNREQRAARSPDVGEAVHPLGRALGARAGDVLALTGARIRALGHGDDPEVQTSFEELNRNSTLGLARWLAGDGFAVASETGRETGAFYGELAARRTASLREVTTRCLCWRDSVADVLRQSAAELDVAPEALSQALTILQFGLEASLVRMAKSFDTESQRTDEELAFVATHDALTGLPNRTLILDRAAQALLRARRHETPVAALFIGLDNFKVVNETLGHGAGDELLRSVAERLNDEVRDTDALGRLGGDEFVVIAEEFSPGDGPELLAQRVRHALKRPFALAGKEQTRLTVTASIGIARTTRSSAEELIRDANIAMYQAKLDGKNRHVVFESGMHDAVHTRMELEMDLRDGLPNDQFFLLYQPTFNLCDLSPTAVEALIRWKHPDARHRPTQ